MRLFLILFVLLILLSGCSELSAFADDPARYEASFLDAFDTVTTIVGYSESEESFRKTAEALHDSILEYHRLYDIYQEYPDIVSLKTVNDTAGLKPVKVDPRTIDLLRYCKDVCYRTDGLVNAAMGSVLSLWHDAREQGTLPDRTMLVEASAHTDIEKLIIDPSDNTVFFADPKLRLDVGAIAKGYTAEIIRHSAPDGLLISIGGNVCSSGTKPVSDGFWSVGIRSPEDPKANLLTVRLTEGCVVTSGDYQRYAFINGQRYHHIIHPLTLAPRNLWRSVTVISADSAAADMLSTALFLMPYADGLELLRDFNAEAMWVDSDGTQYYSDHFAELIKK